MIVRDGRLVLSAFRRNGLEMEQFRTMLRENVFFDVRRGRRTLEPNGS
ncbi:MAG: YetF domain-containing protein [Alistipes sp.]